MHWKYFISVTCRYLYLLFMFRAVPFHVSIWNSFISQVSVSFYHFMIFFFYNSSEILTVNESEDWHFAWYRNLLFPIELTDLLHWKILFIFFQCDYKWSAVASVRVRHSLPTLRPLPHVRGWQRRRFRPTDVLWSGTTCLSQRSLWMIFRAPQLNSCLYHDTFRCECYSVANLC